MIRALAVSLGGYGLSAVVFILFSIFFVRTYGAESYGAFSILLSTVSALTLFGNYHGSLVSFSAAVERRAFFRMSRVVFIYSLVMGAVSGLVLGSIGKMEVILTAPAIIAFVLLVGAGMPAAALLATPSNWWVNLARAVYQSLLIVAFWFFFEITGHVGRAFAFSLLLAAAVYFGLLALRVRLPDGPTTAKAAPPGVLMLSLTWNLAVMGIVLLDKVAIRFLEIGSSATDIGIYLLYFDIAGRLSAIYAIALGTFTYELLRRLRVGGSVFRLLAIGSVACGGVGILGYAVGVWVIPPAYGFRLETAGWLPLVTGVFLVVVGFSSLLLAYCNATGRNKFLVCHYAIVLTAAVGTLLVRYLIFGTVTVLELAIALTVGHAFTLLSAFLVWRGSMRDRLERKSEGAPDTALALRPAAQI